MIERAGRRRSFMLSATGMSIVMFILAAMLAVDTHASGIVAAIMIFAYQAFYTWGFMGGVWVRSNMSFLIFLFYFTYTSQMVSTH